MQLTQEFSAEEGHQWLQRSRVTQGGCIKARVPSSKKKEIPFLNSKEAYLAVSLFLDLPQRLQASVILFGIIEILAL